MKKRDGLVLAGILVGAGVVVTLMILLTNGIIKNPFL